ncbi:bifunctional non-homologous end joining protein LigD [Kaistia soli DSM 19436]|uniref:DNA ligase (ATP) n=1 Tax=Kaistia soli DSM 19436 TaxID=1122133 RepID=A0A1M5CMS2_9HYPH|nr:DNA ligase D [Kaistia soli]SHF56064.1 bifunctional non-homologous end joining protein LigD [Kaistia soli DSM 19436]
MALETYRSKRNFKTTPEPEGSAAAESGNSFVIQKHDATRLHYDFRLEMDGVLKSWAVTRGPSLNPEEKRLAVHVEDHPLDYGDFEGTIPKGEYGGGTVIVWDRGTWTPIGDAHKGYAKGHLEFSLDGERLKGRWHLVRMHGKPGEKRENWLLIKGDDEFARTDDAPDILEEAPDSAKTGRSISEVAGEPPGWSSKTGKIEEPDSAAAKPVRVTTAKSKAASSGKVPASSAPAPETERPAEARKAKMPDFVPPELATLVAAPPEGARWLHEIKFDGYRLIARIADGEVRLLTRTGLDWTSKFGTDVVAALAALPCQAAMIDGELVVEGAAGASDFSALQADLSEGRSDRFVFYAFDLIHLDGEDLTRVPLIKRKETLERLIGAGGPSLRYSAHFPESGEMVLRHACRLSLEGVVSKVADSPYRSGRGRSWVKSKCSARQEFVIGGYVPSTATQHAVGSLLLGVHDADGLDHVGRVGTGFTASVSRDLYRRLQAIAVDKSPFAEALTADERRGARFVDPVLVAEVEFRAWTGDGHLRHASFRGLREDKPASEIVRERAKVAKEGAAPPVPKPPKRTVKLTHPDRIYWPDAGITKEGLADYYAEVWRFIGPHIVGRPLALLRCPEGIDGEKFFQKHAWKGVNAAVRLVPDPKARNEPPFISIDSLDGLMALVQSATLEIHPWGSTLADWERPDRIIMDLDPGEGVSWAAVIEAAADVRARFEAAGLAAFVKTSGGKGLHVVAPLKPKADWPAAKAFTKAMAEAMAGDAPDRYVATIAKAKRGGKILIDYLRNQRGQTAVAAYSTRARPGAAVSMPLSWDELGPDIGPAHFTVANAPGHIAARGSDPWADLQAAAAPLEVPKAKRGRKSR